MDASPSHHGMKASQRRKTGYVYIFVGMCFFFCKRGDMGCEGGGEEEKGGGEKKGGFLGIGKCGWVGNEGVGNEDGWMREGGRKGFIERVFRLNRYYYSFCFNVIIIVSGKKYFHFGFFFKKLKLDI